MMLKGINIYVFFLSFVYIFYVHCQVKNIRKVAVEEIIQKIFNLTSQSLKDAKYEEKYNILKSIENRLMKSAVPLGPKADKYVRLIMQGLRIMAANKGSRNIDVGYINKNANLRSKNSSIEVDAEISKDHSAKILAHKILKLAQKYFRKAEETGEDKREVMEKIKEKILKTAKKKHDMIHNKHDDIKKYTELITRGMELMMQKMTQGKRRMVMEFVKGNAQNDFDMDNMNLENSHSNIYIKTHSDDFKSLDNFVSTERNTEYVGLTTPVACDEVFQRTCVDIESINEIGCSGDFKKLPLRKLCNGIIDCADGSDETNCIDQARERLKIATQLLSRIDIFLLRKCFLSEDMALLVKQNGVLYDVLQKQIGFIDKYKNMNPRNEEFINAFTFKRTINEVAVVINTLAIALNSSLCIRFMVKNNVQGDARKFNVFEMGEVDEITQKAPLRMSLKSCTCSGSFCANPTCTEACKRICWHRYNLGRWSCQAVGDSTSVSLTVVCDGKLDCYDETDENDCILGSSYGKFAANNLFQIVLDMVTKKSTSKEYFVVKSKLLSLGNYIKELQRMVMKPKIDVENIKNIRDICFASLTSIYEDVLEEANNINDLDDAHSFLLSLNEKLMAALKQSHTGNERLISSDGCFCRGVKCANVKCTEACRRSCAVGPKFTRYWCKGIVYNNVSVPLEAVCNGKVNCPFEDDEAECSNDVCRRHHLILFNHNIRDVGEKQKGTSLGEALRTWKIKVEATLKIAENNHRPSPSALRDIVADSLRDLVSAYASIDESRRINNGYVMNEFFNISQQLINVVKSCGK